MYNITLGIELIFSLVYLCRQPYTIYLTRTTIQLALIKLLEATFLKMVKLYFGFWEEIDKQHWVIGLHQSLNPLFATNELSSTFSQDSSKFVLRGHS